MDSPLHTAPHRREMVHGQLDFVAIAFDLGLGEGVTLDIDWTADYGSLPPGEYRLVKDVSPDADPIQNRVSFAAAEFTIR